MPKYFELPNGNKNQNKNRDKKLKSIAKTDFEIKIGHLYIISGNIYILSKIGIREICLINLFNGKYFYKPTQVANFDITKTSDFPENASNLIISQKEFNEICPSHEPPFYIGPANDFLRIKI